MKTFPENAELNGRNVKFGIDPTFPRLHLGHLVPLRIVREMQRAGKNVTIVLGTFTAQMGDPSGKDKTRPILSKEEVKKNSEHILSQVNRFLAPDFRVWRNGEDSFDNMTVPELMNIVSKFTVQHMLSRDAFQKRIENDSSISVHELIVPVLQGMDSVNLNTEIEIGGTDQLFNFAVTRKLQEIHGQKPEVCVLVPIIHGTDGQKMSKSLGNCIFLDEKPSEIFGKCMSIPDTVMDEWIPLLTDRKKLSSAPMQRKKDMAFDIVKQLFSESTAKEALEHFEKTVQRKELPEEMKNVPPGNVIEVVTSIRGCSKSEARRLLKDGAVTVDNVKVDDSANVKVGQIVKVGKRNFGKCTQS